MKYNAYATVVGTKYLGIIEAENEAEAINKAENLDTAYISICHQCSRECEDPEITEITVEVYD